MAKRMLVDATHPEETRVVVVNGNRLEDLDFEIASRKQLKGNIYLAKVTRVEPSLQAAFVEYGGNRHGFLAFSEIHPDYYRIPVADREALLAEEERLQAAEERRLEEQAEAAERSRNRRNGSRDESTGDGEAADDSAELETDGDVDEDEDGSIVMEAAIEGEEISEPAPEAPDSEKDQAAGNAPAPADNDIPVEPADEAPFAEEPAFEEQTVLQPAVATGDGQPVDNDADGEGSEDTVAAGLPPVGTVAETAGEAAENLDVVGGDDVEEERRRRPRPIRSYKIQEVIKRRQIMLVQVTKEERGNKGAALTTYLSLPGRYCVLMPNTGRGGGISRKITNPADRKRLKEILSDLDVPRGMAVILRTAGLERSKQEIRRDLEYLMRLWDDIREQTLKSTAPALIYEEANLIKRAIRDVYSEDIDEIWVEGEAGFRTARDFMRMLMPSHVKRVQRYTDESIPLFHRYQIETQIDAIHSPIVQLRSGGYIVINPTEALVAIDVNSGKSTRERNIEETALKTNLEAAEEVARQLRLRDLAGLIVIDYIDMEEPRNNIAVERRLKEAMKSDRARIQLGRISAFGLLELSRQRLRPSLLETNFERCPHCSGTGVIRSVESTALHVLRAIEDEGIRKRSAEISVWVPTRIALYILNNKRADLVRIEERYHFRVNLLADDSLIVPDYRIERIKAKIAGEETAPVSADRILAETDAAFEAEEIRDEEEADNEAEADGETEDEDNGDRAGDESDRRNRGRRRRRRRGRGERETTEISGPPSSGDDAASADADEDEDEDEDDEEGAGTAEGGEAGDNQRRRRRRGKRGGRRRQRSPEGEGQEAVPAAVEVAPPSPIVRAVLPAPGAPAPSDVMDFDWILMGEEPPPAEPVAEEVVLSAEPVIEETAPLEAAPAVEAAAAEETAAETPVEPAAVAASAIEAQPVVEEEVKPKRKRTASPRKRKTAETAEAAAEVATEVAVDAPVEPAPATEDVKPKRKRAVSPRKRKTAEPVEPAAEPAAIAETAPETTPVQTEESVVTPATEPAESPTPESNTAARSAEVVNQPPEKPRRGWWSR